MAEGHNFTFSLQASLERVELKDRERIRETEDDDERAHGDTQVRPPASFGEPGTPTV